MRRCRGEVLGVPRRDIRESGRTVGGGSENLAANLGLNTEQFDHCLDSREYVQAIERDKREGTRIGVRGTPYFLVNGEALYGAQPYQAFKAAIDRALAQSRSAAE